MVSVRNFDSNKPNVFRFPKWEENVFYPASSMVSYLVDGSYGYYVTVVDVDALDNVPPPDSAKWSLFFTAAIDSETISGLLNDSEFMTYNVSDAEDVDFSILDSDQIFVWDGIQLKWVNKSLNTLLGGSFDYGSY